MFYNELDLLEIRLNYLCKFVDYFVIVESNQTFAGEAKESIFKLNYHRFRRFEDKILHFYIDNEPDYNSKIYNSYFTNLNLSLPFKHSGKPLFKLPKIFKNEVYQRDSIIIPLLEKAKPQDFILLSDVDEIPNAESFSLAKKLLNRFDRVDFQMKWHLYYFNLVKKNKWFGTRMFKFDFLLRNKRSIDSMRYPLEDEKLLKNNGGLIIKSGWHFSFFGNSEIIELKLKSLNYHNRKSFLFFKFIDFIFPLRIKRSLKSGKDIFYRDKLYKISNKNDFPKALEALLMQYPHFFNDNK